jgi:hypothetical protein
MHLDLTDEETAALPRASPHSRERPLPVLATRSDAEGDTRQAQTGAGSRALAAAEG